VLTPEDLASLEATLLPALERHQLRLLAHGLRTLQQIAGRRQGMPPDPQAIEAWALQQAAVDGDASFARAFASQLQAAGERLTAIGEAQSCSALALDLPQLAAWAQAQAEARLR